jgi:hypothetical protein
MPRKNIAQAAVGLLDANGAHRSRCRTHMSGDHHRQAEPSAHLSEIIEIIWQTHLSLNVAKCEEHRCLLAFFSVMHRFIF